MDGKIVIREYEPADKEAVMELLRLNTPRYFAPEEAADLDAYLERERELYYVLLHEERIVGCGGINFADGGTVGKISWDMVHPQYRGKSLGTRLLRHRIEKLEAYAQRPPNHRQNVAAGLRVLRKAGVRAQRDRKGLLGRRIRPVSHGICPSGINRGGDKRCGP